MVDTAGSRRGRQHLVAVGGHGTRPRSSAYGAAKAALNRMTRNIAAELAPRVRVNAIDVGGVATRALDVVLTDDDLRRAVRRRHADEPARRARGHRLRRALPRVADASSWVTGKVFEVDGGTERPAITVPAPPLEP